MEYTRDEHRVHLVIYHLVWCPKRRKAVLVDAIARDCEALIRAKCAEQGWGIVQLVVQPDHVHLFVQASPSIAAAEIVRSVKGYTSHVLRGRYPTLLRLPSLWSRSYFCATAGNVSAATIRRYIEAQKGR
jgi:putative transposase